MTLSLVVYVSQGPNTPGRLLPTGYMAAVSWDMTETVACAGEILGLTIAHELGHLLLGRAHSLVGIMRARWGSNDWRLASENQLMFPPGPS